MKNLLESFAWPLSRWALLGALLSVLWLPLSSAQPPSQASPPAPVQAPAVDPTAPLPAEQEPAPTKERPWLDRLLFNAEERTRRGAENLEEGNRAAAAGAMESALALAPEDARARYNAGTAGLGVNPERARTLLEEAAGDGGAIGARAAYNLGNLHLESEQLEPAIEAYKNALRQDPTLEDAKYNLELAQRRLREKQQEQQNQDQQQNPDEQNQDQQDQDQQDQDQQDQEQQEGQDQQDQDQQDQEQQENQDQQNQDQQSQDEQDQDEQDQDQQGQGEESPDEQDQEQQGQNQDPNQEENQEQGPLPQFQDLPDMTAEEAAAILEAIENLEREQRRQEALEAAAAARRSGKKDW